MKRQKAGFGNVNCAASNFTNACYAEHLHNGCVLYGHSRINACCAIVQLQFGFVNVPMCATFRTKLHVDWVPLCRQCKRVASAVQACRVGDASVSCRWCKRVASAVQACRVGDASVSCRWCKRVVSAVLTCNIGGASMSCRWSKRVMSAVQTCYVGGANV